MSNILTHPDASIHVEESNGKRAISVEPRAGLFTPTRQWVTGYPLELIEHVLRVRGPAYLCDEIKRDEDPSYLEHCFRWDLLSYAAPEDFAGRRVLDFGCGSGASTMVLARMFPEAHLVGVELVPEFVELARHRAEFYGLTGRVSFQISRDATSLPPNIGDFDYLMLSAVYEHLLPAERQAILPLLWSHLQRGGLLFLDQTPYRWFPLEAHTTGLPLLNYLPDRLALACARRFSGRVSPEAAWPGLLRGGVRGGTRREIMSILGREGRKAELIPPSRLGVKDQIGLWYGRSGSTRGAPVKKLMMYGFRTIKAITGATMIPQLALAIRKLS
jgi:SAM-dependent methyltransferase